MGARAETDIGFALTMKVDSKRRAIGLVIKPSKRDDIQYLIAFQKNGNGAG